MENRWTIRLSVDFVVALVLALADSSQIKRTDKQSMFMFLRAHVQKVPSYQPDSDKHANSDNKSHEQDMQSHCIISVTFQNCQDYLWLRHILSEKT